MFTFAGKEGFVKCEELDEVLEILRLFTGVNKVKFSMTDIFNDVFTSTSEKVEFLTMVKRVLKDPTINQNLRSVVF